MRTWMRVRVTAAMPVLCIVTLAAAARAEGKAACLSAHEQGQQDRLAGHFRAAQESFVTCGHDDCPSVVRKDCVQWLTELEARQPTFVLDVRDEKGRDVPAAKVFMDGRAAAATAEGLARRIDPGPHTVRVEGADGAAWEGQIVAQEGVKDRRISANLVLPTPVAIPLRTPLQPPAASTRAGIPTVTYVLGGAAVLALGSFLYFGWIGKLAEDRLATTCAPRCMATQVTPIRRDYIVADVSVGALALTLGAALYFAFTAKPPAAPSRTVGLGARGGQLLFDGSF